MVMIFIYLGGFLNKIPGRNDSVFLMDLIKSWVLIDIPEDSGIAGIFVRFRDSYKDIKLD